MVHVRNWFINIYNYIYAGYVGVEYLPLMIDNGLNDVFVLV